MTGGRVFNTRVVAQKQCKYLKTLEKSGFSQNEIYHANGFSEVVSFRVFQCSRKRMSLIKVYFLLFKRLPRNNGIFFETKERQFSQNEIYHTTELCDVEISSCSSFLGKAGFSNIPCVNVRTVAKKQRKMFSR